MTCPNCGTDCVPLPDELRDALLNYHTIDDYDCGEAVYWVGNREFVRISPPFQISGMYRSEIVIRADGSWEERDIQWDGYEVVEAGHNLESLMEWL